MLSEIFDTSKILACPKLIVIINPKLPENFQRILEKNIRIFFKVHNIFWVVAWKNILKFPQATQTFSVVSKTPSPRLPIFIFKQPK